jgi:hypothetical protein
VTLGKLSALQQRILVALSPIRPVWTLTGERFRDELVERVLAEARPADSP